MRDFAGLVVIGLVSVGWTAEAAELAFRSPQALSAHLVQKPTGALAADLDGDAYPETISYGVGGASDLVLRRGTTDGPSPNHESIALPGTIVGRTLRAGRIDADGDNDLVVVTRPTDGSDRRLVILFNDGSGRFPTSAELPLLADGSDLIALVDLDRDGALDVLGAESTRAGLRWHRNLGGAFAPATLIPTTDPVAELAVGDVDGDGFADAIVGHGACCGAGSQVGLLAGNGDGSFSAEATLVTTTKSITDVELADLDADLDLDLLLARTGLPITIDQHVYRNDGGAFIEVPPPADADGIYYLAGVDYAIADVDGDGALDVVGTQYGGNVAVYLGNGDLTFRRMVRYESAPSTLDVAAADLDADGRSDVVLSGDIGAFGLRSTSVIANTPPIAYDLEFEVEPNQSLVFTMYTADAENHHVWLYDLRSVGTTRGYLYANNSASRSLEYFAPAGAPLDATLTDVYELDACDDLGGCTTFKVTIKVRAKDGGGGALDPFGVLLLALATVALVRGPALSAVRPATPHTVAEVGLMSAVMSRSIVRTAATVGLLLASGGCATAPLALEASRGCDAPVAMSRSVGLELRGVGIVIADCDSAERGGR